MTCKLEAKTFDTIHKLQHIQKDDITKVATTMLDAYKGTVDQQENTVEEAIREVEKIVNNGYGPFISEASYWIELNNEAAAVVCINLWNGRPLITEIYTGKNYHRQGLARTLILASMNTLFYKGYDEIDLNVTLENTKALHLYDSLGFTNLLQKTKN
ncbi:GNAT family N-acetyltransferase [Paenisporosarcina indica]|uniref:GNAT family N-acetyltransferase n=1 Tax=Paenisporosarcina indica TaxID=650093 RepID=UPI00094F7C2B|nr:GNAT family N-acetyltransferase [Paenisporosarcina indica]